MAYEQHTWQSNEFVTAEKLNNIENGVAYSQGKKWEVTIAANSWTLDNDVYTYTTSLGDITSASWVDASAHGYEDYFTDPIDWEIKSNNVVEFSTTSVPTGTIIVTVVAWGTVEGTEGEVIVPIYDGVDSTDANKALSAKQGKIINDKVSAIEEAITPFVITITTGQWSGADSDRYITVNASNVNENSILIPRYDHASESVLNGPIWCVPANGSFTIHTTAIPSGSITVVVLFAGTMGEAQYQVLADVYSKSQTYSKTETDSAIAQSTAKISSGLYVPTESVQANAFKDYRIVFGKVYSTPPVVVANCRQSFTPVIEMTGPNIVSIGIDAFTVRYKSSYNAPLTPETTWIAIGN